MMLLIVIKAIAFSFLFQNCHASENCFTRNPNRKIALLFISTITANFADASKLIRRKLDEREREPKGNDTMRVAPEVEFEEVVSGFTKPVAYIDDPLPNGNRKFVVEKKGVITVVKNGDVKMSTPFLDLKDLVTQNVNEGGLLGFAFHPNYNGKKNRFFFVYYTELVSSGSSNIRSIVRRMRVSSDNPDIAKVGEEEKEVLLKIDQPYKNHNGGQLLFGPKDKLLYIFVGDGGSGGDPKNFSQDLTSFFGKILRIKPKLGKKIGYRIPKRNPYRKNKTYLSEILHYGVRNPWRNSFDRETGHLYIGDVGQNKIEEISIANNNKRGLNFGWRLKEGNKCYNPSSDCNPDGKILQSPIITYPHQNGDCSVIGGYVYRGSKIPSLEGKYIYGDFCSGKVRVATKVGNNAYNQELLKNVGYYISSFAEDKEGELYIVDYTNGAINKISPKAR